MCIQNNSSIPSRSSVYGCTTCEMQFCLNCLDYLVLENKKKTQKKGSQKNNPKIEVNPEEDNKEDTLAILKNCKDLGHTQEIQKNEEKDKGL